MGPRIAVSHRAHRSSCSSRVNVQHRGHLESEAGLTRIPTALAGTSTSPSGRETPGGCNTVIYSHPDSCFKFRKAASSRTLMSETTDSVFRMVAGSVGLNGHVQQRTENYIRSRRSTPSSLQVESPCEGRRRSIPASSELRSCLKTAVSDRRSKNQKKVPTCSPVPVQGATSPYGVRPIQILRPDNSQDQIVPNIP